MLKGHLPSVICHQVYWYTTVHVLETVQGVPCPPRAPFAPRSPFVNALPSPRGHPHMPCVGGPGVAPPGSPEKKACLSDGRASQLIAVERIWHIQDSHGQILAQAYS